jgi:hypothetical protein
MAMLRQLLGVGCRMGDRLGEVVRVSRAISSCIATTEQD